MTSFCPVTMTRRTRTRYIAWITVTDPIPCEAMRTSWNEKPKQHKTLLQHLPITSWTVSCKGLISSRSQISLIFLARSIFISRMMPHGLIELIINHAFWQLQDRNCCMHLVSASHCGHWCRTMQNALRGTKKFQHPEGMNAKKAMRWADVMCNPHTAFYLSLSVMMI